MVRTPDGEDAKTGPYQGYWGGRGARFVSANISGGTNNIGGLFPLVLTPILIIIINILLTVANADNDKLFLKHDLVSNSCCGLGATRYEALPLLWQRCGFCK